MGREISFRAYAKVRGCSHSAVNAAVKSGRLVNSVVGEDGKKWIKGKKFIDPVIAAQEWAQNTDATMVRNSKAAPYETRIAHKKNPQLGPAETEKDKAAADTPGELEPKKRGIAGHRSDREKWLSRMARLEYEEKAGLLVNAEEVKALWVRVITESKIKLLGLPSKAKSLIPHLTLADINILERLVREALEDLVENAGDTER